MLKLIPLLLLVSCLNLGNKYTPREDNKVTLSSPTSLSMSLPSTSFGLNLNPKVLVFGVEEGDLVEIYSDESCTSLLGSQLSLGSSVEVTLSIKTAPYKFHALRRAVNGRSECSLAYATYTPCPENFAAVPGDDNLGTSAFCVMRFEARDGGSATPVSTGLGDPWTSITIKDASNSCRSLGGKYDLIANPEWMTIARNIEKVGANWDSGQAYTGCIFRGNNGLDDSCGYDAPGNFEVGEEATRNLKARHVLDNGQTIWDLAGNVTEWVDWSIGGGVDLVPGAGKAFEAPAAGGWIEFASLDSNINNGDVMNALTWQPEVFPLDSSNGIGRYDWGDASDAPAARGGRFINAENAGIYMLDLSYGENYSSTAFGFRCVYRP